MSDPSRSRPAVTTCPSVRLASILLRRGAASAAARVLQERYQLDLPSAGRLTTASGTVLLWSGPDRLLAVWETEEPRLARTLATLLKDLAYVVEASSSRAVLTVAGDAAADALNRLLPIDLHPRVFDPGSVALTMAGHIAVQVWRPDADSFRIACPASLAASFRRQLTHAGLALQPLASES